MIIFHVRCPFQHTIYTLREEVEENRRIRRRDMILSKLNHHSTSSSSNIQNGKVYQSISDSSFSNLRSKRGEYVPVEWCRQLLVELTDHSPRVKRIAQNVMDYVHWTIQERHTMAARENKLMELLDEEKNR